MKRVSAKVFFTVLWRGLCQALGWFFGLFGYKRDGNFAKCVWGLFASSAAVIVAIMAGMLVWSLGETFYEKHYKEAHCYDPECSCSQHLSRNVYYLTTWISFHASALSATTRLQVWTYVTPS